jgi:HK97 family phage prohead protease
MHQKVTKMNPEIEKRMHVGDLKVERAEGEPPKIRGYAAVFNSLSEDLGGFREQISVGAFADAMGRDDVRALVNHDPNLVLGRNKSGTLVMREDGTGLSVEITPPDTQAARDLVALMERGDVSQMSFAFTVSKEDQSWERSGTGPWLRTIRKVARLFDVSVVTYPAYAATSAAVRALEQHQQETATPPDACPTLRGHLITAYEKDAIG